MRYTILLITVFAAGCEGDDAKIDRLKNARMSAWAETLVWKNRQDSVYFTKAPQSTKDSALRVIDSSAHAAQNRLDLADRELNKFMSGR